MTRPRITAVRITPASTREKRSGLRAFVSFVIDDALRVDGITVRLSARGRPTLAFPARRDRHGVKHPYVAPIDADARRALEAIVFDALWYGVDARSRARRVEDAP